MEENKKKVFWIGFGCAAGAALLIAAVFMAGILFGRKSDTDTDTKKVVKTETKEVKASPVSSNEVVILNDVIFFFSEQTLGSALVNGDGTLGEVVSEGTFSDEPMDMAVVGEELYFTIPDGIFRMNLKEKGEPELISEDGAFGRFVLLEDTLYYMEDDCVCGVSAGGGKARVLTPQVEDYEITEYGIYYTTGNGSIYRTGLDGKETETVAEASEDARMMYYGNMLYLYGSDGVKRFQLSDGKIKELSIPGLTGQMEKLLVTDDFLLYDTGDETRKYDFDTKEDTAIRNIFLPSKGDYQIYGGHIFYHLTGEITGISLDDFEEVNTDVKSLLNSGHVPEKDEAEQKMESGAAKAYDADTYDISRNLVSNTSEGNTAFVASDDFNLYLNYEDFSNGLWDYKVTDMNTITFYYTPAEDARFGGVVFYLSAYDWGDNGYAEMPDYQIAGTSEEKKYIVSFPTDLQYDPDSSVQKEEYTRLSEYAHRIEQENPENPFSVY